AQIPGVGEVSVGGSSLPAVRVQVNPHALANYGIPLDQVRRAISATNSMSPRGMIDGEERQWQIGTSDQMRRAADYLPLVIRYRDGAAVRQGDVETRTASVEARYSCGCQYARTA